MHALSYTTSENLEYSLYLEFYYFSPPKNYPKSWIVNNTVFSRRVSLALFPYRGEYKILCPHSFLRVIGSSVSKQSLVAEKPVWFNIVLSISETPAFNFQPREALSFHVSVEVLYFKTSLTDLTQHKKAPQRLCHSYLSKAKVCTVKHSHTGMFLCLLSISPKSGTKFLYGFWLSAYS